MPPILAAAQFHSERGQLARNLEGHLTFMRCAADQRAEYLLFPELSLTGYEPDIARELAVAPEDDRLEPIRSLAMQLNLATTVGIPLKGPNNTVHIGALTFTAEGEVMRTPSNTCTPARTRCSVPDRKTVFRHWGNKG